MVAKEKLRGKDGSLEGHYCVFGRRLTTSQANIWLFCTDSQLFGNDFQLDFSQNLNFKAFLYSKRINIEWKRGIRIIVLYEGEEEKEKTIKVC